MFGGRQRPKIILMAGQGVETDPRVAADAILERPDPQSAMSRPILGRKDKKAFARAWAETIDRLNCNQ